MDTDTNTPVNEDTLSRATAEHARTVEMLRQDVSRFTTMIDMLPAVVFETNLQGRITFVNKFAYDFFGASEQEFREGLYCEDQVIEEDRPRLRSNFADVLEGARSANEYTIRTKKSVPLAVIIYSDVIRNQTGEAVGVRGIIVDISIRKQIENTLKESESRYKNLFMTIDDAAFIYDAAAGTILDANAAAEQLYGYSHGEFLTMTMGDLSAAAGTASFETSNIMPPELSNSPLRYHRKSSGALFPVELSSGTFEWQGVRYRFDIYRDLTRRRKAEIELRASEARLELYLNAMHDGLWDWDLGTGEIFYSPGWADMLGYQPDDVPPHEMFWRKNIHKDDEAELQRALDDNIAGRTSRISAEFRMRTKRQEWKWIGCRGSVVEWTVDGKARRLIATFSDISERRAVEERLRDIAHENRVLMEHASEAILITTDTGEIVDVNTKACELFEYSRAELLSHSICDMVPPEEVDVHPLPFDVLRSGSPVAEERIYRKKYGALITVESSLKSLPDGRIHAILRNITERKRAETEFKSIVLSEVYEKLFIKLRVFRHGESMAMNLNRLLLFAQNITDLYSVLRKQQGDAGPVQHMPAAERVNVAVNEYNLLVYPELRSIGLLLQAIGEDAPDAHAAPMPQASGKELLVLNDNVKMLIGEMKELLTDPKRIAAKDDDVKKLRREMLRDVDSLKHRVNDLMKLVEAELACDIVSTVSTVVTKYSPNAYNVPIYYEEPPVKKFVIGRPAEIGEIVSILIHNALQAMESDTAMAPSAKNVFLQCREAEGRIVLVIQDSGPGVDESIREKIFEDGFTTKAEGHGFGLSYARSAIRKYGGKISYEHNVPRGARFIMELVVLN
jgi:PAS domain S-box-containing protein